MVKVSVVVPMYNVKNYIRQALDSLINQSLQELEIIIVNDGSTDGSRDIAAEYAQQDSRIVIVDQPNGGYGKAMNNGLAHAKGDYVGILEPDDYVDLAMFEELYLKAIETGANIVRGGNIRFWDDEQGSIYKLEDFNQLESLLDGADEGWINIRQKPTMYQCTADIWSAIYSKDFLVENNITFVETPGASYQDLPFFIETTFVAQKIYAVNKNYYHYRQSNPNSSIKANNKAIFYITYWHHLTSKLPTINKNEWERSKNQIATIFWYYVRWAWTVSKPSLRRAYLTGLQQGFKAHHITIDDPMYRSLQKYGVTIHLIHMALTYGHPDIYRFIFFIKKEFIGFVVIPIKTILFLIKKMFILSFKLITRQ